MGIDLDSEERNLIIAGISDSEESVSKELLSVKEKLNDDMIELTKEEAKALYSFIDESTSDMGNYFDHQDEVKVLERIQSKLESIL